MKRPPRGLYPIVGMYSRGEKVRYLGHSRRLPYTVIPPMDLDTSPWSVWLRSNGVKFLEDGLTLEYCGEGLESQDIGIAQANCRLNWTNHYFEMEILSAGKEGWLAIGLAKLGPLCELGKSTTSVKLPLSPERMKLFEVRQDPGHDLGTGGKIMGMILGEVGKILGMILGEVGKILGMILGQGGKILGMILGEVGKILGMILGQVRQDPGHDLGTGGKIMGMILGEILGMILGQRGKILGMILGQGGKILGMILGEVGKIMGMILGQGGKILGMILGQGGTCKILDKILGMILVHG
eukprot:Em0017g72a